MAKTKATDILTLIEQDHRKVEQLFAQLEQAQDRNVYDYFNQIYQEFVLHARAEELVFYPAMGEYEETEGYIEAAEAEHADAETLLEELKQLEPKDPAFMQKVNDLKQTVNHHVQEEERSIFAAVRQVMDEAELQVLGDEFQAVKTRVRDDVEAALAS